MNKAIFLDRDGVILNDEGHYYIYKTEDLLINDGIVFCMKEFYRNGFLLFIISNQGGISKNIYTKRDADLIHEQLINQFGKEGIVISEIYYCPHHPDIEKCICRKPGTLLIEKAVARFDIDVSNSFFIGDNDRDIIAAQNSGLQPIKINSNEISQQRIFSLTGLG